MAVQLSCLERFVRRICMSVPEYRGPRLSYPSGALILGVLLSECGGRLSQKAKARWLASHWPWIRGLWHSMGGKRIENDGTPSQPTLSRLFAAFSEETFARLLYDDERKQLGREWLAYLERCEVATAAAGKKNPGNDRQAGAAVLL